MQDGEVCGRLLLLLSMSAGYKLSIMKGKETWGTRQGLQTRPAPPHTSTVRQSANEQFCLKRFLKMTNSVLVHSFFYNTNTKPEKQMF